MKNVVIAVLVALQFVGPTFAGGPSYETGSRRVRVEQHLERMREVQHGIERNHADIIAAKSRLFAISTEVNFVLETARATKAQSTQMGLAVAKLEQQVAEIERKHTIQSAALTSLIASVESERNSVNAMTSEVAAAIQRASDTSFEALYFVFEHREAEFVRKLRSYGLSKSDAEFYLDVALVSTVCDEFCDGFAKSNGKTKAEKLQAKLSKKLRRIQPSSPHANEVRVFAAAVRATMLHGRLVKRLNNPIRVIVVGVLMDGALEVLRDEVPEVGLAMDKATSTGGCVIEAIAARVMCNPSMSGEFTADANQSSLKEYEACMQKHVDRCLERFSEATKEFCDAKASQNDGKGGGGIFRETFCKDETKSDTGSTERSEKGLLDGIFDKDGTCPDPDKGGGIDHSGSEGADAGGSDAGGGGGAAESSTSQ